MTDKCMFLRECICLRHGPGACEKCGESNKYSSQEKCWYCDCECGVETCMIDRNPSKKYFAVKDTEKLFYDFKNITYDIQNLAAIVQNNMVVDLEQVKEWLVAAGKTQKKLNNLIKETAKTILEKQVSK